MSLRIFISIFSFFFTSSAWAILIIEPGEYSVPALLVQTKKGPEAIFNLKSASECRILLVGPEAEKLHLTMPSGRLLSFKIEHELQSSRGSATLLSVNDLGKTPIPLHVGNNFKPEK